MAGQFAFAREAIDSLAPLLANDVDLLLGHGNGPQVGHMLIRVEEALGKAYALPLEVCVAETEGELGYVLAQTLRNACADRGMRRSIASVLTQVVVDPNDPTVRANAARINARAAWIEADLEIAIDTPVEGRRALVVEDGPTVTHGGMSSGAGLRAARDHGALPIDPRPYAVGTIAQAFADNPHLGPVLPALGYSEAQRVELAETIARTFSEGRAEIVIDASPARLDAAITGPHPVARVSYRFVQRTGEDLASLVDSAIRSRRRP